MPNYQQTIAAKRRLSQDVQIPYAIHIISKHFNSAVNSISHPPTPPILHHLNIRMSSPRMRTPVTAMTPTPTAPSMSMSRIMRLPHINILLLPTTPPPHKQRQHTRKEKENTIHNPKRPTRLQHRARLINRHIKATDRRGMASNTDAEEGIIGRGHAAAAVLVDIAELVDARDKGADEAQVDEGDEPGVGFRAVVGEEGGDGPDGGEDRDDEEDEDVVGG